MRLIVTVLVGAIIAFAFQAASWMVLPIHENSMKYTEKQDEILSVLTEKLPDEGLYALPGCPPGSTKEQMEAYQEKMSGKPWAMVYYHKSMTTDMGPQMAKGFAINFFMLLFIALIIQKGGASFASFGARFAITFSIFIVALLQGSITEWNWWETPWHALCPEIIDTLCIAFLVSIWVGAYFKPKKPQA